MFTKSASALQQIYNNLPRIACQRKCQDSCGMIPLYPVEAKELLPITPPQAVIRLDNLPMLWDEKAEQCPHLRAGACSVHETRPLLCRLWGLVKAMRCPYGCVPERWLSDKEAREYMRQVKEL